MTTSEDSWGSIEPGKTHKISRVPFLAILYYGECGVDHGNRPFGALLEPVDRPYKKWPKMAKIGKSQFFWKLWTLGVILEFRYYF